MKEKIQKIKDSLLDEEANKIVVSVGVYSVLGIIALVMSILNIITSKGLLTLATGAFSLLSFLNLILCLRGKYAQIIAQILFTLEILAMFTYFLVSGNPEGFSAFWACMLPSFGMLIYGRKYGSIVSAFMLADILFFLWTARGSALLQYEYTQSFTMRFPIMFTAFYLMALVLETMRVYAFKETKRLQTVYRELSVHDQLTGLLNRQGMYNEIQEKLAGAPASSVGFVIFDLDHFKAVNDTHGHNVGDEVLKEFARLLRQNLKMTVCRWGGEEFAGIFFNDDVTPEDLELFRRKIEEHQFRYQGLTVNMTVSAGVHETAHFDMANIQKYVTSADVALYDAKRFGRNCVVYSRLPAEV